MEFEKCPRCGGEWKRIYEDDPDQLKCVQCSDYEVIYYPYNPNGHNVAIMYRIGNKMLGWHHDGTCGYSVLPERPSDFDPDKDIVNLPWLPFDITEERLKLLLVFS